MGQDQKKIFEKLSQRKIQPSEFLFFFDFCSIYYVHGGRKLDTKEIKPPEQFDKNRNILCRQLAAENLYKKQTQELGRTDL